MKTLFTISNKLVFPLMLLSATSLPWGASAATINISFVGSGVSGTVQLTYGTATDAKYAQAFEVTGVTGTFSDSNNGLNIVNASVGPLEPINRATPEPTNLLAPVDFSRFAVATGLPPDSNGFVTYDNLYYPAGSPPTASDYPVHGGILDIYGLLFDIGGGRVVNLWSNGSPSGTGTTRIDYGVSVTTRSTALDYVGGGVSVIPEPSTVALIGGGLLAMLARRRSRRETSI